MKEKTVQTLTKQPLPSEPVGTTAAMREVRRRDEAQRVAVRIAKGVNRNVRKQLSAGPHN